MCGLCSAIFFTRQETVSSVEIPRKERVEVAGPADFLFPGPTSSPTLDWSQLDADQRLRTYARTQRIALGLPPACSLSHSTRSFCSLNSQSQNNNPPPSSIFDNVTSTQPHQTNKPAAGLVSVTQVAIITIVIIATLVTTPRHRLQLR